MRVGPTMPIEPDGDLAGAERRRNDCRVPFAGRRVLAADRDRQVVGDRGAPEQREHLGLALDGLEQPAHGVEPPRHHLGGEVPDAADEDVLLLGTQTHVVDGLRHEPSRSRCSAGPRRAMARARSAASVSDRPVSDRDPRGRGRSAVSLGGVFGTVGQRLVHAAVLADQQDQQRGPELDELGARDAVLGGTRRGQAGVLRERRTAGGSRRAGPPPCRLRFAGRTRRSCAAGPRGGGRAGACRRTDGSRCRSARGRRTCAGA